MRRAAATLVVLVLATVCANARAAGKVRIAVMELEGGGADPELKALGKGLQSMITTDLANVSGLEVVERERLGDIQAELRRSKGKDFDRTTAARLGKLVGATHLFVGSYTVAGETMRIDGRLVAVQDGAVVLAEQIKGEKALFFELQQQLTQKVIAALGVKLAPKEKAALARPHTADFQAFTRFAQGIDARDDGRLEDALKALQEATAIDKDFRLASLTLEEYERLAAQVRAKAAAAGTVEDEVKRLEKNKILAAQLEIVRKLWPILGEKGTSSDARLRRVAAACVLEGHYRTKLGTQNRGPITAEDLGAAGFDDFALARTADALAARAWDEAPDVFPRVPPLCFGFGVITSLTPDLDTQLGYQVARAAELAGNPAALVSYMGNPGQVEPVEKALHLDAPGEVRLWERLYALAQKLPVLSDDDRTAFERTIAERRRHAGDFDGSTEMYAALSRRERASDALGPTAKEIDTNRALRGLVGKASPAELRELYLLGPELHARDLPDLAKAPDRLRDALDSARSVDRDMFLLGGTATWRMTAFFAHGVTLRTGPRTTNLRADELRYQATEEPKDPILLETATRGSRITVRAAVEATGARVGVAFAMSRVLPEGAIQTGAPEITIAHAILVGGGRAALVKITRDGEHDLHVRELATAPLAAGGTDLEVKVEPGKVAVTLGSQHARFTYQPDGDGDGFVGYVFLGKGTATLTRPQIGR